MSVEEGMARARAEVGSVLRRPGVKAIGVAFLILVMMIPMIFVTGIVVERAERADDVRTEIGQQQGAAQIVAGPFLVVPIDRQRVRRENDDEIVYFEREHAVVLPEALAVDGEFTVSTRYRGIYDVTVYQGDLVLAGRFLPPDFGNALRDGDRVRADDAFLVLQVSDNRGIRGETSLSWNGAPLGVEPGPRLAVFGANGAHAPLPGAVTGPSTFRLSLTLNGSQAFRVLPAGRVSTLSLAADWPHPSFQGGFLPEAYTITDAGFEADWQVNALARGFPQSWIHGASIDLGDNLMGVDLADPLDHYAKVNRATKYAVLFFGFIFLTFFLAETLSHGRVHAVQYLMIGASQCVFYLLLLSLSETIAFREAYWIAAAANIALVSLYGGLVLASLRLFLVLLSVLLTVYGLLYSLLVIEDYALLFGSIATFIALAVTMFATRRVNWYGGTREAGSG